MVFRVRERLETLRPVRSARVCRESGWVSAMVARRVRFFCERTRAKLSVEGNQTFGSSAPGFSRKVRGGLAAGRQVAKAEASLRSRVTSSAPRVRASQEVACVVGGQSGGFGEVQRCGMVNGDGFDPQAGGEAEGGAQGGTLAGMAPHFGQADIGQFVVEQGGSGQSGIVQARGDQFGFGFREQEGGEGGGVDDFHRCDRRANAGHGHAG
jgi:hypothetical protein